MAAQKGVAGKGHRVQYSMRDDQEGHAFESDKENGNQHSHDGVPDEPPEALVRGGRSLEEVR